jgi:hypothetical protein
VSICVQTACVGDGDGVLESFLRAVAKKIKTKHSVSLINCDSSPQDWISLGLYSSFLSERRLAES